MNAIDLLRRLHQHRAWVNGNLLAAAAGLSDEQLRRRFEIGQGSIWLSLTHMYGAEFVWLAALEGNEEPLVPGDLPGKIPGNQEGQGGFASLGDLREKWSALANRWTNYLASLTTESLDDMVYKKSLVGREWKRFGARRSDVLLHVCTHAHYTTAQVVNMLRHSGVEKLPGVMLMALARHEAGH